MTAYDFLVVVLVLLYLANKERFIATTVTAIVFTGAISCETLDGTQSLAE